MANPTIACTNCGSIFKVPANAIGAEGRKLRCSNCGNNWHAMPHELRYDDKLNIGATAQSTSNEPIFVEELLTPPKQIFVDELLASSIQNQNWLIEEQKPPQQAFAGAIQNNQLNNGALNDSALNDSVLNNDALKQAKITQPIIIIEKPVVAPIIKVTPIINQSSYEADVDGGGDGHAAEELPPSNDYDDETFDKLFSNPTISPPQKPAKPTFYANAYLLLSANLICFLLLAFTLLIASRDELINKIPASSAFYRLIGYQQTNHLRLADVTFTSNKKYGTSSDANENELQYVVKGKIINQAPHASLVPIIRARMFDKYGDMTNEWELASNGHNNSEHVIPIKGEKTFSLKLPAIEGVAVILAVDIGSNIELALRK